MDKSHIGDFICNQKRGGTTLRSNAYRLLVSREQAPRAQYPLTITYNSIVVRPPYKKTLRLQKSVPFGHSQKTMQRVALHPTDGNFVFGSEALFCEG